MARWWFVVAAAVFVLLTEHVGYAVGAPLTFLVPDTAIGLLFVLSGAIAWHRRPLSRTGPILLLCSALWVVGSYSPTALEPFWVLGFAFEKYYDVALAVLALTFPAERLGRTGWFVVGIMGAAFGVRSIGRLLLQDPPRTLPDLFPDGPTNPFALLENRAAFEAVDTVTSLVIAASALTVAALAVWRLLHSSSLARPVIAPVLVASVVAMLFAALAAADVAWAYVAGAGLLAVPEPWSGLVEWLVFGARALVPIGFLVGTVQLRSAGGPLTSLAARIADDSTPDEVDAALRTYIENDRLADLLVAQLAELRASRARLVSAGDEERRRIERDLHDGAQQHLTALAIRLDQARHLTDGADPALEQRLAEASRDLGDAIHELRELARGIHPAILTDAGLEPALATLARRSTVPVDLEVRCSHLPSATEVTAYYVVAEALTNIARNARARRATVSLDDWENGVRIVISDDGIGGADASKGSGIVGLRDRVQALHGRFRIESPAGAGTRVEVWLPCE